MSVTITSDYSEIYAILDVMSDAPSEKGIAALSGVMEDGLLAVRAATHRRTGSLAGSETAEDTKEGALWTGVISAGGPSTGVNNPVDYAIYEYDRGGAHDFMAPLDTFDELWIKATQAGFTD
jgi:hypothetical protein